MEENIVSNPVPADVGAGDGIPSSIVGRGSAVYLSGSGTITLVNNIIALNQISGSFQQYHDVYTESGTTITESYNIVGNFRGSHTFSAANHDIVGDTNGNVNNLNLSNTLAYLGGKLKGSKV